MLAACLAAAYYFLDSDMQALLSREGGVIEIPTAMLFGMTALAALWISMREKPHGQAGIWQMFAFFMAAACFRELDLHKTFTTDSIFKSKFYVRRDVPVAEKIIGFTVICGLVYAAIRLLLLVKLWIKGVWNMRPVPMGVFFALGLLVVAKSLDAMARLFPFLAEFHAQNRPFLGLIEESFELAASGIFFGICVVWIKTSQHRRRE